MLLSRTESGSWSRLLASGDSIRGLFFDRRASWRNFLITAVLSFGAQFLGVQFLVADGLLLSMLRGDRPLKRKFPVHSVVSFLWFSDIYFNGR
jgi:hypothetical protein